MNKNPTLCVIDDEQSFQTLSSSPFSPTVAATTQLHSLAPTCICATGTENVSAETLNADTEPITVPRLWSHSRMSYLFAAVQSSAVKCGAETFAGPASLTCLFLSQLFDAD